MTACCLLPESPDKTKRNFITRKETSAESQGQKPGPRSVTLPAFSWSVNCSANQTTCELDNIELKFLPPNTTARLQPLDHSTKSFNVGYRRRLLGRLLMNLRVGTELKVDQLGAIHMMTGAWNSVKQSVANCFRKAGFVTSEF
ncbi:hypothetical protein HPB48_022331 [Haemaphysalis longicornis]|uniref:DDE-1 domain-containing protein n=1 Tax=Haemaphysalis longicornis TaxID=44386 RepID=A0A9J6FC57_HAELO|nr:hypothetical protein HPB48_022331 [Haemaphysalis longicornis]